MSGWIIEGFQYMAVLAVWAGLVLLHGVWRSLAGPETDPIRPSGPVD